MPKNLIIVESPNKIKTIQGYVGDDYEIIATCGHLRELNRRKGYDDDFNPIWQIIPDKHHDKKKIIESINKAAKKAEVVYLATDPDREGEAISWHVWDLLPEGERQKCFRITFNEVTKTAILKAIEHKSEIDWNLVYSQFTRRIIDRIIGYKLSQFVKKTLKAFSAGRVQSVALLFVVERALERQKFVPEQWWEISATLDCGKGDGLPVHYIDRNQHATPFSTSTPNLFRFKNKSEAEAVFNTLGSTYELSEMEAPKESKGDLYRPITTDKMLQLAATNLGWSAAKTTSVAQRMFEGVAVDGQQTALISYPRTDSERLSEDFIGKARAFLLQKYGEAFYSPLVPRKPTGQNIQDAHEAIRPIDPNLEPEAIKHAVTPEIYKLYKLIWTRTMASLMPPPQFRTHGLIFVNNGHQFYTSHREVLFDGYLILPEFKKLKAELKDHFPNLKIGQTLETLGNQLEAHETQPPAFYTEASLIVALKNAGVGRPSTYAQMARIGEERGYVNKEQQKLIPNALGTEMIEELRKCFPNIISKEFTSRMEDDLDQIANGAVDWKAELRSFAPQFNEAVERAYQMITPKEDEKVGRACPDCGHALVYRMSRYHKKFIACSNYPACHHTESLEKPEILATKCPECGNHLIIRKNKRGDQFVGCTGYPKCHYRHGLENGEAATLPRQVEE